jgi:hypothetical protein
MHEQKPKPGILGRAFMAVGSAVAHSAGTIFGSLSAVGEPLTPEFDPAEQEHKLQIRPSAERRFRPREGWSEPEPKELPRPTYAPATVAMGITLAAAGVVTSGYVSIAGGILFVLGLWHWIGDLTHEH